MSAERQQPHSSDYLSQLYSRDYFLSDCEGYDAFRSTAGRKLTRRLSKCRDLVRATPGENVLDVGHGRGEIALQLAERGVRVVAVDPSPAAVRLLQETKAAWLRAPDHSPLQIRTRGESLPIAANWADACILSDVVEHLHPAELRELLREIHRVLRPDGRLVVHTQPNRRLVELTVPLLARFSTLWGVRLPRDLRQEMSTGARGDYHPNEQTCGELTTTLKRAGFTIEEAWLEGSYPIHRIFGEHPIKSLLLARFRRSRWLKELFASQIFALARKPSDVDIH